VIAIAPVPLAEGGPDHLVLELWDDRLRAIVETVLLQVTDAAALEQALGIDLVAMRTDRAVVPLDAQECALLATLCGAPLDTSRGQASLLAWTSLDALPYLTHTNRELAMMLAGTKPLAMFYDSEPSDNAWTIPEDVFTPHVTSGRFVQRDLVWLDDSASQGARGTRFVFYALAVEAWRIDAYLAMKSAASLSGDGGEALERLEGALLGYAEWQNAAHLEQWRAPLASGG
jgi:hypothetical protein